MKKKPGDSILYTIYTCLHSWQRQTVDILQQAHAHHPILFTLDSINRDIDVLAKACRANLHFLGAGRFQVA